MNWPSVSSADPAFRFGLGIFETLRVAGGKALFEPEHRGVFHRSAEALGLPPVRWEDLGEARGEQGIWRWFHTPEKTFSIFEPDRTALPAGFRLTPSPHTLCSTAWEARHKTLSYLLRWQARREAEAAGFDEAILSNERGEVCGASMANVFWVCKGVLRTPCASAGCREGVVRGWILRQAGAETVQEPMAALDGAEEIFLTNSRIGIMPVLHWAGRGLPEGSVTRRLRAAYAADVS
jgi:branched-subunit amino acid aminotransferase/4-amino-4-deoxychorismate lyase